MLVSLKMPLINSTATSMFVSSLQGLYAEFVAFETFRPFVVVATHSIA